MSEKSKEFGKKLRDLLEKKNMTQREFAKKIFTSESTIGNYVQGTRLPRYEILKQIADFFGVTTDYLLGFDDITKKLGMTPVVENIKIPILGTVQAGLPTLICEENIIGYECISEEMKKQGELFALYVKGDSMEPRMFEGDIVIVKRTPDVESGKLAVVLVNGAEATIKKIKKSTNGIALIPFNLKYDILTFSNDEIINKPVIIVGQVIEIRAKV